MGSLRSTAEFAYGDEGEHIVADTLRAVGWSVLPVYQFALDTAPLLFKATSGTAVLPDMLLFGKEMLWVEVKRKNQWVNGHRYGRGRWETGCDLRLYREYLEVQAATGLDVVLFFLHEGQRPCGLFSGRASALKSCLYEWGGLSPSGARVEEPLALFDRAALSGPHWPELVAARCGGAPVEHGRVEARPAPPLVLLSRPAEFLAPVWLTPPGRADQLEMFA